jgi:hypothetical protein
MTVKNVRSILQTNHTKGSRSEPSLFSPLTLRPLTASRSSGSRDLHWLHHQWLRLKSRNGKPTCIDKKLVVVPEEAVHTIFTRYLEDGGHTPS